MYTKAIFKGADIEGGRTRLIVVFTGPEGEWVQNYYPSGLVDVAWLRRQARQTLSELNAHVTLVDSLVPGELDLTPDVPPPLTEAEAGKQAFFALYGQLQNLRQLADVAPADDVSVLEAKVKEAYRPEYFK